MNELKQTIDNLNTDLRELTEIFRKRSEELDRRAKFDEELEKEIARLRASYNERHKT